MNYREQTFLRTHMRSILNFYHPACIDREVGGYINQFLDDGTIFDHNTKHLVGTCRFIYNYAIGWLVFGDEAYRAAAAHGIRFLRDAHRQQVGNEHGGHKHGGHKHGGHKHGGHKHGGHKHGEHKQSEHKQSQHEHGGFAWVLQGRTVEDATRHCYGHAFVLLAAAGAIKAGVEEATPLLEEVAALIEERFWEADAQLYVDEIAADDWAAVDPYRGQNANMHMCEAMLIAYEATKQRPYLERAHLLATRICVDLATASDGLIWEHFMLSGSGQGWQHDWDYNKDDPQNLFRPYGYLPGHFVEWTKLLLILEGHCRDTDLAHDWMRPKAQMLFDAAMERCWDPEKGGMHYAFAPDGQILDTDRYYWVLAETFAAAALLANRTGDTTYWDWYDKVWAYADRHFVDHEYGGWYRVLDENGNKYSNEKSPAAKTDYHPLAACYEALRVVGDV